MLFIYFFNISYVFFKKVNVTFRSLMFGAAWTHLLLWPKFFSSTYYYDLNFLVQFMGGHEIWFDIPFVFTF
jgi:hypothetical protein